MGSQSTDVGSLLLVAIGRRRTGFFCFSVVLSGATNVELEPPHPAILNG